MTASSPSQPSLPHEPARLTLPLLLGMIAASLALFAASYVIGSLFGMLADRGHADIGARTIPAQTPAGVPELSVKAWNIAFDTRTITVPAGREVTIRLQNDDAGILHNIAVYTDQSVSQVVQRGALFDGPHTRDYRFQPFEAGSYFFQCDLHPNMSGVFIAR
jgi:plastocyanin